MLAYVAALYDEVSPLLRNGKFRRFPALGRVMAWQSERILIAATGWGAEAASTGAGWLARSMRPSAMVAIGYSGGTRPDLAPGSLVIGEEVARIDEVPGATHDPLPNRRPVALRRFASDRALIGLARLSAEDMRIPFAAGLAGTIPHVVSSARLKASLGASTGALAVDLETWHFASAADGAGIPFLSVRAVVDSVDDDLPGFVERMGPGPRPSTAIPALRYVIGRPAGLPGVIKTGLAAGRARRALAHFAVAFSARWPS